MCYRRQLKSFARKYKEMGIRERCARRETYPTYIDLSVPSVSDIQIFIDWCQRDNGGAFCAKSPDVVNGTTSSVINHAVA